jgi:hypothetical protein
LLVGELFVNSIRHSGSGAPGETITVAVKTKNSVIRIEVTDRSGPGVPEPRPVDCDAEDGRGLQLVAHLAARWGWRRRGGRTMTWFEIQALLQPMHIPRYWPACSASHIQAAVNWDSRIADRVITLHQGIPHDPHRCSPPVLE